MYLHWFSDFLILRYIMVPLAIWAHIRPCRMCVHVLRQKTAALLFCCHNFSWQVILMYCNVMYYTVLYCTVLYGTLLYCTVLYCTALHSTAYCTVLYCIILNCTLFYPARSQHSTCHFWARRWCGVNWEGTSGLIADTPELLNCKLS